MKEAYANCRSYQDTGLVTTKSDTGGPGPLEPISFKTYFVRPDKFRFEWETRFFPGDRMFFNVAWSNGGATYTYWESGKLDKMNSLQSGIRANAGVSGGSSYIVPSMLICPENSTILTQLVDVVPICEELLGNTICFLIQGRHLRTGEALFVWVGKHDYLLRKLKRVLQGRGISEETHLNVMIDPRIPPQVFIFVPPEKKGSATNMPVN
jgi:hypothetical protein